MQSDARVAVVTGYYKESPEQLLRCVESVAAQTYPCTHFLVSDGYPSDLLADLPIRHILLGKEHRDYGDTPRTLGSLLARREGFDAVCYLDADNFYLPEHVQGLITYWDANDRQFDAISTRRFLLRPDGSRLPSSPLPDPWRTVDTNCMFLAENALSHTALWTLMPQPFHVIGDRIFWDGLCALGLRMGHLPVETVAYTTLWQIDYERAGEPPPPNAKDNGPAVRAAAHWWMTLDADSKRHHIDIMGFDPTDDIATLLAQDASAH